MARNDDVLSLVRAHFERDNVRFLAATRVIEIHARKVGHLSFADSLARRIEIEQKKPQHKKTMSRVIVPSDLARVVTGKTPSVTLEDMTHSHAQRAPISRMINDHAFAGAVRRSGYIPIRKVLFYGPSGVGKTMVAEAFAEYIDLPLYTVHLHAVISSMLGETAARLHKIFDAMTSHPGVWFFDEFDALVSARDSRRQDVGEMDRVVNTLLTLLDDDPGDSIIICATNLRHTFDRAILRRFDEQVEFLLPNKQCAIAQLQRRLKPFDVSDVKWDDLHLEGLSQAHLESIANNAAKVAIINEETVMTHTALNAAVQHARSHLAPADSATHESLKS